MRFCIKALTAGIFTVASFSCGVSAAPTSDLTPQMAYEDISRSLAELEPVTFQAKAEKHKLLVFVENQCVYCSYVGLC